MIISEVNTKSIIVKSNLPEADFVINPYTGCQHSCIYCYADFIKKYTNHTEEWGEFIDIKINSPDLIKPSQKYFGKTILMSSVTDPYIPIESKYKISRRIIKKLIELNPNLEILTKSHLVKRDFDLLSKFKNVTLGFSLSSLDSSISKLIEPKASSPEKRINILKQAHEMGFKTYLFVSPIFPHVTEIDEIIETVYKYTSYLMFENLNVRANNRQKILKFIDENKPDMLSDYHEIYFNSKNRPNPYWIKVREQIINKCKKLNIESRIYFQHAGIK